MKNKITDKFYSGRIVCLPPMTWASAECADCRTVLKNFIDEIDLFSIKPDTRVFGYNAFGKESNANALFASIPDDLEIPDSLQKIKFCGGLYLMFIGNSNMNFNMNHWLENNDKYESTQLEDGRPIMEEFINPYNRYGWINNEYNEPDSVTDVYFPIKPR